MLPKKPIIIVVITSMIALLTACTTHQPLQKTDYVDPARFTGDWYVISNIPYFAERNKVGSKTTYLKVGDNDYQDIFESRDGSFDNQPETMVGKAKSLNTQNTEWQSTFYWIVRFKFEVLDVDPDYQIMLFGHKSRNYGWVMARNKTISDAQYQQAMNIFTENGYDTSKFAKVPQFPSDLGQTGYQLASN